MNSKSAKLYFWVKYSFNILYDFLSGFAQVSLLSTSESIELEFINS